jgi:hypothetical protein
MKTKHFIYLFIFNVLTKLGILIPDLYLYSIKIQTNIDQNAVTYLRKITIVFEIICEDNIFFFRAGPNPAHVVGLDPATRAWSLAKPVTQTKHARVKFYACMEQCKGNYITFALFMLVFADSKNEPLFQAQKLTKRIGLPRMEAL